MAIAYMFMPDFSSPATHTPAKVPGSSVEPRSLEELLAYVESLTSATKALTERSQQPPDAAPVAAVGYDLEKVAALVGQIIEARKLARNALNTLL